jgi:hypothetical protein
MVKDKGGGHALIRRGPQEGRLGRNTYRIDGDLFQVRRGNDLHMLACRSPERRVRGAEKRYHRCARRSREV